MSDALNFLVKARPAAMTHYFSFLKIAASTSTRRRAT